MGLLLDTHILVWIAADDARLTARVRDRLLDPDERLFVSAIVAWEYADLEQRGRFVGAGPLGPLIERLGIAFVDYPADLWTTAHALPAIHRDPVDRMLIAHTMAMGVPLVTADTQIRRYPIETVW